jgi:DNA-binding PadR family transcriptional regulator
MSGYDIRRYMQKLGWLLGSSSFGVIYPTLHALHEDGLVSVQVLSRPDRPPRKTYTLTQAGRGAWREWLDRSATPGASLKSFVMYLVLADGSSRDRLLACLRQRHEQVSDQRAALERMVGTSGLGADGGTLAVDYGLAVASAELAWLDKVLDRLSREPLPGGE